MGSLGSVILKLVLEAVLTAFGKALTDMFETFRLEQASRQLGRAETEAEQARLGNQVLQDMQAISDDIDVEKRLSEGSA